MNTSAQHCENPPTCEPVNALSRQLLPCFLIRCVTKMQVYSRLQVNNDAQFQPTLSATWRQVCMEHKPKQLQRESTLSRLSGLIQSRIDVRIQRICRFHNKLGQPVTPTVLGNYVGLRGEKQNH